MSDHIVQFYETDDFLMPEIERFVRAGLQIGEVSVLVATTAHIKKLAPLLKQEKCIAIDAHMALSNFMIRGKPDAARFSRFANSAIEAASARGGTRIRAFGEMVGILATDGQHAAALELEGLWNETIARHGFPLYCAYPMSAFLNPGEEAALANICNAHSHVSPPEMPPVHCNHSENLRA